MTNRWEELELVLVALVPAEFHRLVTIVHDLEGGRLRLIHDAIANHKFIFVTLGQSLKSNGLCITLTNDHYLVLFIWVVLGVESQQEFLHLSSLGDEGDIECVIRFRGDRVIHVTNKVEAIILDDIKTSCSSNRAFIL